MNTPFDGPIPMPGGQMSARQLHFIWIVDCSGSMGADGKIEALNNAIREAIPHMCDVADDNPNAQILVRVLKFSNGAEWHQAQPVAIEDFRWKELSAFGVTDLGKALRMVAEVLTVDKMPGRALPPVLTLVSDGQPTDDFDAGLQQLMDQPWGKKAVRIAIAIGADADLDRLQQFIGHAELRPLQANNPEMLVKHIRWVSTVVTQAASSPPSTVGEGGVGKTNVPLPKLPLEASSDSATTVW